MTQLFLICHFKSLQDVSKFLQYFGNTRHNLATLDAFAVKVKVMSHTRLWDAEFAWYSLRNTHEICFNDFEHSLRIYGFRSTWPCLEIKVLRTQEKFEPSGYCIITFFTTNIFGYFYGVMAQFEHVKHHHHHHIVLVARISLTLSRHSSLSFIALGRSSGQQPVSSHSCWMYVRAGRPAFARPCVGIHKSTSLMSSSLLLQQCPACLVRLTWIVFVIGGRWLYSWCLVGCCCQDLFRIAHSILV